MKYFRFDMDKILWGMSFANLQMYMAAIPDSGNDEAANEEPIREIEGISDISKLLGL